MKNNKYFRKIIKYKTSDTFVVFYRKTCPYSIGALNKLKTNKLSYKGYAVGSVEKINKSKLIENLKNISKDINYNVNHDTFPIIFRKGKFIGGFSELETYLSKK